MRKLAITSAAAPGALAAVCASGEWLYEGQWVRRVRETGGSIRPCGIAVTRNREVYVAEGGNGRVQYIERKYPAFAATGRSSALGAGRARSRASFAGRRTSRSGPTAMSTSPTTAIIAYSVSVPTVLSPGPASRKCASAARK
jgi:hypothetical protein